MVGGRYYRVMLEGGVVDEGVNASLTDWLHQAPVSGSDFGKL